MGPQRLIPQPTLPNYLSTTGVLTPTPKISSLGTASAMHPTNTMTTTVAPAQPLAAAAVATLHPANLTATLKETVTAHPAATATPMTTAILDPSQTFKARWETLTRVSSPMEVLVPALALFLTPPWQAGQRGAVQTRRGIRLGIDVQPLAEGLGTVEVQESFIRVEDLGENMNMEMEMEMKIVWRRFRVLNIREGRLGAGDKDEGMPSRRR